MSHFTKDFFFSSLLIADLANPFEFFVYAIHNYMIYLMGLILNNDIHLIRLALFIGLKEKFDC